MGTGGNILIPGFVVGGSGTETLLIRADGPSLTQFGVGGVLAQPSLKVGMVVAAGRRGYQSRTRRAVVYASEHAGQRPRVSPAQQDSSAEQEAEHEL